MLKFIYSFRHMLVVKLILAVGLTLLCSISTWAYFNIKYQKQKAMKDIVGEAGRLSDTILVGTHYAMMLNSRNDINQIILAISRQKGLEKIRIFNKAGQIKFSNDAGEVDKKTDIKNKACVVCHRSDPPLAQAGLSARTRIFESAGHRNLGIISPIYNEPGCATIACHVHPEDKKVLGALDLVFSLEGTDREIRRFEEGILSLAAFSFIITAAILFFLVFKFVNLPIRQLIRGTQRIADGKGFHALQIKKKDELGLLALAIDQMGKEIAKKTVELNRQRDEYQNLFEQVPCLITVQDQNFKLVGYNREFAETFNPKPDDYCYHAYKSRDRKCESCAVEKTFADGKSHSAEESGMSKDGSEAHWIVKTSPITDAAGNIVAAMEMSIDITDRRILEQELKKSEQKYQEIFNNIPNPAFVLEAAALKIVDCNRSVLDVYGYEKNEILERSFLELFRAEEKATYAAAIKTEHVLNQVRQLTHSGLPIYVDIWISPSEYAGQKVFLVTTSDITQRLEAEQQLIQAGKMGTLGEMATGVAHELNQPLSVIKTASSFCIKKINHHEEIGAETLFTLLNKIDSNVDRAAKIITHMRQFARKTDMMMVRVQTNDILERAYEIFSQQFRLRGIEVSWELEPNLPPIMADPDRLEQVFINLILNARDAIEEKWTAQVPEGNQKRIAIRTASDEQSVTVEIRDSGIGIPRAIADKIFEPFFTTKKVGKGTGLGLSISYGIVKECGGSIRFESESGQGARFILTFPRRNKTDE